MVTLSLNPLPFGFRFQPTGKDLVDYFLRRKINGIINDDVRVIPEVDVYKFEPWDLLDLSCIKSEYQECVFFSPLGWKYPNGNKLNRVTKEGYWKPTGTDREIMSGTSLIGMKKILVFYKGKAPKGQRTDWVMHEYRTTLDELDGTKPGQKAFVVCLVFNKQCEKLSGNEVDSAATYRTKNQQLDQLEVPRGSLVVGGDNSQTCPMGLHDEVISNTVAPTLECNNNHRAYSVTNQQVDSVLEVSNRFFDSLESKLGISFRDPNSLDSIPFESDAELAQLPLRNEIAKKEAILEIKAIAQDCTIPIFKQHVNFPSTGTIYKVLTSNAGSSNHVDTTCNIDTASTGINIKSRPAQSRPDAKKYVKQGNARRRVRMRSRLQAPSLYCGNAIKNWNSEEKEEGSKAVVKKEVKVMEEDITSLAILMVVEA